MEIPFGKYNLEQFLEYIVDNLSEVFDKGKQRKWLKGHLVYAKQDWKEIFSNLESYQYGEITKIKFNNNNEILNFYAYEWAPGLLMLFTSSTEEDYEKTLKQFITERRGITQCWIKPSIFENVKNILTKKYEGQIYRFIAKRRKYWKTESQLRSDIDRRLSYSGEDAEDTLKETKILYGLIPTSIDLTIYESKIQINRSGLIVIRHINKKTIGILREIIDEVSNAQASIQQISETFKVTFNQIPMNKNQLNVSFIRPGKIILQDMKLSEAMIRTLFNDSTIEDQDEQEEAFNFSFIDVFIQENPELIFGATVIDEEKGTIFGLSGLEKEIILIPKHRTTFESFIKFYNIIEENFDQSALLTHFSEY